MDTTIDPILGIRDPGQYPQARSRNPLRPGLAGIGQCDPASWPSSLGIAGELIAGGLTHTLTEATLNDALGRGFGHGVFAILLDHLVASRGPENALTTDTTPTVQPADTSSAAARRVERTQTTSFFTDWYSDRLLPRRDRI